MLQNLPTVSFCIHFSTHQLLELDQRSLSKVLLLLKEVLDMQKKVQRKEVDLKITSDNSPSRLKANPSPVKGSPAKDNSAYGLPNPDILAQKYGLPREGLSLADQYSAEAYNGPPIEEYEAAIKTMKGKIDEKNRKIEHLCVLLEALEPAPGVDPARLQAIVQDRIPDEQIDIRDGKIVSLAKKSHRLTMQLIKERSVNDRLSEELEESRRKNDSLTQEMQLLRAAEHVNGNILRQENKTYNRNAMAAAATSKKEAEDTTSTVNIQKQLRDQAKSIDELRIQVKELHDENKSLTRALTREVGEGVSVEQAVDGGWRGRAQQIILLRAKVKQLEAALGSGGGNLNSGSTMTFRSNMGGGGGSTVNGGRGMDVDARAAEDINEMSRERRQVVEALTEERVR